MLCRNRKDTYSIGKKSMMDALMEQQLVKWLVIIITS